MVQQLVDTAEPRLLELHLIVRGYSVMQSNENSFGGNVVFANVIKAYRGRDIILYLFKQSKFFCILILNINFFKID